MLAAEGIKKWVDRKIMDILWMWAHKWGLLVWEELSFLTGSGSITLVGGTIGGRTFRILFHIGKESRHLTESGKKQPPHIQLVIDGLGTKEWLALPP
jgi:hypothetical protein